MPAGNPRQFKIGWSYDNALVASPPPGTWITVVPTPRAGVKRVIEKMVVYTPNTGIAFDMGMEYGAGNRRVLWTVSSSGSSGEVFRGPIVLEGTGDPATTQSLWFKHQSGTPLWLHFTAEWIER